MSEESNRSPEARRKRVQRLKKDIILVWFVLTIVPIICCVVLHKKVKNMDQTLLSLEDKLDRISVLLEQQAEQTVEHVTIEGNSQNREIPLHTGGTDIVTGVLEKTEPEHRVYLTFDDGPSEYTDDILDILNQYGVKATFFVIGKEDAHSKEMMQRIVEEGHTLGMHSYSHRYQELYESLESFSADFEKQQDYLYEVTGVRSTVYRFPGGSSNQVSAVPMDELFSYLQNKGVTYYDWNVSAQDATSGQQTVQEILENCTESIPERDTSIILMHDAAGKHTTVEALPMLIEKLLGMENTELLPITEETEPIQHRRLETNVGMED